MKRYNCTLSDKRGAFGLCMEEHKEGMFVPFSEVGPLNQRINQLLEERNATGIAISNAILSGIVPDKHPLRSRLELLANHRKREQALEGLLREVLFLECRDGLSERIEAALAGELPEASDNSALAMMMDELHDICVGLDAPGGAQNGAEAWEQVKAARDMVLAGKLPVPAVTVTETIRTAPERIWLQVGDQEHYHSEPFPRDTSEVSWCAESVAACEVPYVRADLAGQVQAPTLPEGWELVSKATCFTLVSDGQVIASMAGPTAEGTAAILASVLAGQVPDSAVPDALVAMSDIASLQRYTLGGHCDSFGQDCGAEMEQDDEGEYVLLADALMLAADKKPEHAA